MKHRVLQERPLVVDREEPSMTVGSGALRPRLGDYILVAKLSEDAMGSVHRAIHAREGRFARLRLLESPELSRAAVLSAIQKRDAPHRLRSFHPPGRRETLGIAEGHPFLAWNETSGWTLDVVLAASRKTSTPIPIEGALKIVAGAAAALEHARASLVGGEPARHGVLWPGLVTLSRNAEIWVRGYGLAAPVIASIGRPRLDRLIGPYLAPETRTGSGGENADVYSLGVLLLELLTGQAPTPQALPTFAADDPFSEDVADLVKAAIAPASERLASVVPMRKRLEKLLEDCPYQTSNANLALFLEDLLAPEKAARPERAKAPAPRAAPVVVRSGDEPGASRTVWALRVAAGIVSLATLAALDLSFHRREAPQAAVSSALRPAAILPSVFDSRSVESELAPAESLPLPSPISAPVPDKPKTMSRQALERRQTSELAQAWRLRAALSRVSAQRVDAWNLASEPFRAGRVYENDGERLLSIHRFSAAHEAFERAADLYLEAETLAHQERARVIRVSTLEPWPDLNRRF